MEPKFYKRYVIRFTLICLGLFIVMSFVPLPGIINVLIAAGVAFYVGTKFGKDHGRVNTPSEQNRFSIAAFLTLVGVVAVLTFVLLSIMPPADKEAWLSQFQGRSIGVMIVGTVIAVLMLWGSIHTGFGLGVKKSLGLLGKKKQA